MGNDLEIERTAQYAVGYEQPLTTSDVAAMLGAHPKTIERKARAGDIPGHFKINRWFFFPSELDKWLRFCVPSCSQFVNVS